MLRVTALGEAVCKPGFFAQYQGKPYFYPVGYTVERPLFGIVGKNEEPVQLALQSSPSHSQGGEAKDVFFTIRIGMDESGTGPLFTVARSDEGPNVLPIADKSPVKALRQALEKAVVNFPTRNPAEMNCPRDAKGIFTILPVRMLGLSFPVVTNALKTLPGAEQALKESEQGMRKQHKAKAESKGVVADTPLKPSGANEVVTICEDCGLSGTPFCSATGKPHLPPPCPLCGLRSTYCPETGAPHQGAILRPNRKRGEVVLPKASSRQASKKPVATDKPKNERKTRKRGVTTDLDASDVSLLDLSESGPAPTPLLKRRRGEEKQAKPKKATTALTAGDEKAQAGGASPNEKKPPKRSKTEISLFDWFQPEGGQMLKPVLNQAESAKALSLLAEKVMGEAEVGGVVGSSEKEGDVGSASIGTIRPPFMEEMHLSTPSVTRKVRVKKATKAPSDATEDGSKAASPGFVTVMESIVLHPLEISLKDSQAMKRYVKFMQQYTSERAKIDLLRASQAANRGVKSKAGAGDKEKEPSCEAGGEQAVAEDEIEESPIPEVQKKRSVSLAGIFSAPTQPIPSE